MRQAILTYYGSPLLVEFEGIPYESSLFPEWLQERPKVLKSLEMLGALVPGKYEIAIYRKGAFFGVTKRDQLEVVYAKTVAS